MSDTQSNPPLQDFDRWHAQVGETVSKEGFVKAFEEHCEEIVQAFANDLEKKPLGQHLAQWILKDPQLKQHLESLGAEAAEKVKQALEGRAPQVPGPQRMDHRGFADWMAKFIREHAVDHDELTEGDGSPMKCLPNQVFQNWGRTVENTPALTCIKPVTTFLIDALHFQRGIQNMRVLDMEFEIPIPPCGDDPGKPDWNVVRQAWWDAIKAFYDDLKRHPLNPAMRLTLEMRIMNGSKITMAPQYGNQLGTCAIEVLTPANVDLDDWQAFMQKVADKWAGSRDSAGKLLNVRSHWAKQWQGLIIRQMPVVDYFKKVAYKDRIPEFKSQLQAVAQAGGYTLNDLKIFLNPLLSELFEEIFA